MQQEPRNGGAPCPPLEERAGCLDYSTAPGQDCGHSFGTGGFTVAAFVVCAHCQRGKFRARRGSGRGRPAQGGQEAQEMLDKGVSAGCRRASLPHPLRGRCVLNPVVAPALGVHLAERTQCVLIFSELKLATKDLR